MIDTSLDKTEIARRFAEETDDIASRGAAPDCADQLRAFHSWFDVECARSQDPATRADGLPQKTEVARR